MKKKKNQRLRLGVQIAFFLLVAAIAISHTLAEAGTTIPFLSTASIHAICPFGGVETFYQLVTTGDWIQKIHASALVLFGIVTFLAILFGPVLCGWICPLGSIQEWIGSLGKRIFGKRYNRFIPYALDKYLRFIRYGVLGLILFQTFRSGQLLFENADPYYALFHFWNSETSIIALVVLGVTLALSLFVERPWCKYACPYGAMLGITNLFRVFKIRRNPSTCTSCQLCTNTCPMNIEVAKKEVVNDHQCISCLKCTSENVCPISDTVVFTPVKLESKVVTKKNTTLVVALVTVVFFFGGIIVANALGLWQTESTKTTSQIKLSDGSLAQDPMDIKGSFTFLDVAQQFDIEEDILRKAFGLNPDQDLSTFQSKDLETLYADSGAEIGNESLQVFVALYKQIPVLLEDAILPQTAVDIIKNEVPQLSPDHLEYLNTHAYTGQAQSIGTLEQSTPAADEEEELINGNSTFYDVLQLGLTKDQVSEILGLEMPAENIKIRSFCQENGISFSAIKAALAESIEKP